MTMFGGYSAIYRGSNSGIKSDLLIQDIANGSETDDVETFAVTEDIVDATLATDLFNSKGPDRFRFQHQTFAECLSARYLDRMPFRQLQLLLCKRDAVGEYVVPQLAEVAAGRRQSLRLF